MPKRKWGVNNKGRNTAQSFQSRGKETMAVKLSGEAPPNQKRDNANNQESKFPSKVYSFKDEQVVTIFHPLHKGNKLKLPDVRCPDEVGYTNDPNYCLFHRMVHHPTDRSHIRHIYCHITMFIIYINHINKSYFSL